MPSGTKYRWSFRLAGSIGLPPRVTVPSVAGETPARHSNSVVFPEPFGPMRPRISPSLNRKPGAAQRPELPEALREVVDEDGSGWAGLRGGLVVRGRER